MKRYPHEQEFWDKAFIAFVKQGHRAPGSEADKALQVRREGDPEYERIKMEEEMDEELEKIGR